MKVSSRITLFPLWVQAAASDFAERQVSLTIYLNFARRLSGHRLATIDEPPNKLAEISTSARSKFQLVGTGHPGFSQVAPGGPLPTKARHFVRNQVRSLQRNRPSGYQTADAPG